MLEYSSISKAIRYRIAFSVTMSQLNFPTVIFYDVATLLEDKETFPTCISFAKK